MAKFRTAYTPKLSDNLIDYSSACFFIGSCFSNNISEYLSERKFKVNANPYGILFNPLSIVQAVEEIIAEKKYTSEDLVFHNELYYSMQHHSDYSNPKSEVVVVAINESISRSHQQLKEANFLFITLGTSWVYEYEGSIVANCHKIPNTKFAKRLLNVSEIKDAFMACFQKIKNFNPKINIVFTLSPVRHLKDGFVENNLSKAILRVAVAELQAKRDDVAYFPAYEIVQDDLRDYRFYAKDLVHPNDEAVDYVWQQFKASYIDPSCLGVMERIEKLQAAISHRPRFPETEAYQKHLAYIEKEKQSLQEYF